MTSQNLETLPVVTSAEPKLNNLQAKFGWTRQQLLYRMSVLGNWYIDKENDDNINIFLSRPDYVTVPGYIRVTIDPTRQRIISAGLNKHKDVQRGVLTGRFLPL